MLKRRDFINRIFEEKLPIRILIDENCRKMIADLMYCKQAVDGTKDKHIVTDKETGDRYQKYGHLSDGFDYLLTEAFKNSMMVEIINTTMKTYLLLSHE